MFRIKKYDFNYGRRILMEKAAKGITTAGVLAPLWPMLLKADSPDDPQYLAKAYPEELLSIEAYTKGKLKPGDRVTADNVELVKDLLGPIVYEQVRTMGRVINIKEANHDITKMYPHTYLEATLRNWGRAVMDDKGNTWADSPGNPWVGGHPFPEPKTGLEAVVNMTLSWGRRNFSLYAIDDLTLDPSGDVAYNYHYGWAELQVTGREDGSIWRNQRDMLRYQSVFFTRPRGQAGTAFLNRWPYDQSEFPELLGYLPAFRRVREFPTDQRFEPLVPGITFYLSDAWATGDPLLTWGNYKMVERKPFLGVQHGGWYGEDDNWQAPLHGGPKGQTFRETYMELLPEVIVVDSEPVGYPRSPVGKKRIFTDARNFAFPDYCTYDRRGEVWKSFEPGFSQYVLEPGSRPGLEGKEGTMVKDDKGNPLWSWTYVMSFDIQSGRMSHLQHSKRIAGGFESRYHEEGDEYDRFLTESAMAGLGT